MLVFTLEDRFCVLWEAPMKSAKKHQRRFMGKFVLNYEEFRTLFCQIEMVLNSLPSSFLNDDPKDESPLITADLSMAAKLEALPSTVQVGQGAISVSQRNFKKRWACIQAKLTQFWKRRSKEYVASPQERSRWRDLGDLSLRLGDLVYTTHDNIPPLQWPTERVKKLYFGRHSIERVVKVKTGSREYNRAVHKLQELPLPSYWLEIRLICVE